jgi:hypothetical protein
MDDHIGTNKECTGVVANPVADEKARNLERVVQERVAQERPIVVAVVKNKTKNIKHPCLFEIFYKINYTSGGQMINIS